MRRFATQRFLTFLCACALVFPLPTLALAPLSDFSAQKTGPKVQPIHQYLGQLSHQSSGMGVAPAIWALAVHRSSLTHVPEAGSGKFISLDALTREVNGNKGYIGVAMRVLASQGWVKVNEIRRRGVQKWEFQMTPEGEAAMSMASAYSPAMAFMTDAVRMREMLFGDYREQGDFEFEQIWGLSQRDWNIPRQDDPLRETVRQQILKHLDGMVVGPIMVGLGMQGPSDGIGIFEHFDEEGRLNLKALQSAMKMRPKNMRIALNFLQKQGWLEVEGSVVTLTAVGKEAAARPYAYGVPVSYYPTYAIADELLYGDPSSLKRLDEEGDELLVDRGMNVWGSGGAHKGYFEMMKPILKDIFDNTDFANQPEGIVDVGCGNGKLLKEFYHYVMTQTERGRTGPPLKIIGVDLYKKALEITEETLTEAGVPHVLLQGDIRNPDAIARALYERHGLRLENMLSVRSFLDHNRPWEIPSDMTLLEEPRSTGIFAHRGEMVPNALLELDLRQHVRRWSKYIKRFGLMVLELHTIAPELAARNIGRTLAPSYDASHGFSDQYILELDVFERAFTDAGMVAKVSEVRPRKRSLATVSLHYFVAEQAVETLALEPMKTFRLPSVAPVEGPSLSFDRRLKAATPGREGVVEVRDIPEAEKARAKEQRKAAADSKALAKAKVHESDLTRYDIKNIMERFARTLMPDPEREEGPQRERALEQARKIGQFLGDPAAFKDDEQYQESAFLQGLNRQFGIPPAVAREAIPKIFARIVQEFLDGKWKIVLIPSSKEEKKGPLGQWGFFAQEGELETDAGRDASNLPFLVRHIDKKQFLVTDRVLYMKKEFFDEFASIQPFMSSAFWEVLFHEPLEEPWVAEMLGVEAGQAHRLAGQLTEFVRADSRSILFEGFHNRNLHEWLPRFYTSEQLGDMLGYHPGMQAAQWRMAAVEVLLSAGREDELAGALNGILAQLDRVDAGQREADAAFLAGVAARWEWQRAEDPSGQFDTLHSAKGILTKAIREALGSAQVLSQSL